MNRAAATLLRKASGGQSACLRRRGRRLPLRRCLAAWGSSLQIEPGVQRALEEGRPIVALESTIISHGMPYPENLAMARGVEDIIRERGAVPATVAVLQGRPHVGLTASQLESLAEAGPRARKCSRRDLAVALAQGVDGATTVAATSYLASLAGVKVFVTGGMGGVHRGAETTFDVSADLAELAQTPIVVVCAGVKSILDIEKTLEVLETNGVPVVSLGTDDFPAFFSPSSGVPSPLRLDTPSQVAAAAKAGFDLGMRNGMVVAVPNPTPMSGGAGIDAAIHEALEQAEARGLKGRDITPFVLASVNETTGGNSLKSNVALVRYNAKVGADIAVQLAALTGRPTAPGAFLARPTPTAAPPLRVAVFGGAVADIVSKPPTGTALTPGTSTPGETRQSFGGVGRNVAEGVARVLLARRGDNVAMGIDSSSDGSGAVVTLASVVGADEPGKGLVAGCEEAGVNAEATVEVGCSSGAGNDGGSDNAGTASYVAVLGGDGDLVAAVADMRVLERMTADFVERHASIVDGASVVIADGNLPPEGFARVSGLCAERNVPLVFEPTSVAKCSVPFSAEAVGGIALSTPNLDELAAMSSAALGWRKAGSGGRAVREGHSLATAALADGKLVDARPLGPALKAVLEAMLGDVATPMALLDGARHVVVTLGSAGVVLASARPCQPPNGGLLNGSDNDNRGVLESPLGSGRWFALSAEHYPALPLERPGQAGGAMVADCTGAGDCLVAGLVGGLALGWSARESTCLGLLCARQSVLADRAVPETLGDIFGSAENVCPEGARSVLSALPEGYGPKEVHPWAVAQQQ
ncbi:unnamed protein product [Ectocarpus sp. 6 AP-2014]